MASGSQIQFWYSFSTVKRNSIYINRYHAQVEAKDRQISIFSAIASSSSIAGWVIWKDLSFVWGFIIAASQVLAVIKPYLPYKSQLKALSTLGPELDGLAIAAEEEWFSVSRGLIEDEQIHKLTMSIKKKSLQATTRAFKAMSLPIDEKLEKIAEKESLAYMSTISGDDDD